MDGESTSFSWSGLFPESLSPGFEVVMPQETQDLVNRRSQVDNKTTRTEIESTCTFTDILVQDEHSESQTTTAMERRPRKPVRQGIVSGSSPQDMSAAGKSSVERRRTQVKLAQRAYRQRKDDTLAALGRQCDDLKETIRNINEAFNGFYSETCDSGIGSREPKHIHYLIQIAKYIGDLADLALDEASKGVRERNKKSNKAMPNSQFEERSSQAQWSFQPRALLNQAALDGISANWNASFTAGIPELCISDTGGGVVEAMDPLNDFLCPSPMLDSTYLTLHTNTVERATFARRLQRDALERGFELVTNPNTPLSILNYAFEHCLPVRSREQITYRLQVLLKQSDLGAFLGPKNDDDQQNMPKDSQSNLINQIFGTGSPSRLPNGLGLFPQVREPESGLSQSSQEFLSAQDVESYLTSKGIVITSSSKLLQLKIPQDQPAWQPKSYQAAILSVNKLIENVLDRAVCLFTGPGFRKVDVESALRTSIRVSA